LVKNLLEQNFCVPENEFYFYHTDHLGSSSWISDQDGKAVQHLQYLPFGESWIDQRDGTWNAPFTFSGKERDWETGYSYFGARYYDSDLSIWLSVDPKAHLYPSLTPYNYCLNSPVMYIDPNGEWVHIVVGAVIGGVMNWIANGAEFTWQGLGYFAVGAAAGALSAGIGAGVNVAMTGGSFAAGFVGASSVAGVASTGFGAGFITGFTAGFSGSFTTVAGNTWMQGGRFGEGLFAGLSSGFKSGLMGGVTGGIMGGIDARMKDVNFWTSEGTFDLSEAYGASGKAIGDKTITGKYVGRFEGVNMYEADIPGGITLPGRGIIVYEGAFSRGMNMALVQHEFGHILQAGKVGLNAFYKVIAPESFASASLSQISSWNHDTFWTETWANYLAHNYFWTRSLLNNAAWPAQDISRFNLIKLLFAK